MDPLSALSLASCIVQFVDFSSKLISKGHLIYSSANGALIENLDLEVVTCDLSQLTTRLGLHEKAICCTKEDQNLEDLASRCSALAKELLDKLDRLKVDDDVKNRRWKSFRQALKTVWSKKDLDEIAARLAGFRSQLELYILVSLRKVFLGPCRGTLINVLNRERSDLVALQHDERFNQLDERTKQFIDALREDRLQFSTQLKAQTAAIGNIHHHTEQRIAKHIDQSRTEILNAIRSTDTVSDIDDGYNFRNREVFSSNYDRNFVAKQDTILHSLGFPSRYDRYESVAEAHAKTFNWIFEDSTSNDKKWSSFTDWLKRDESIYWISGKAGSGKSTLMKYICEDRRTPELLAQWGGPYKPVLIASFFFWISGSPDQSSQLGLLRSLLHDILSQRRDLIPIVLRDQWIAAESSSQSYVDYRSTWTHGNTRRALKQLLKLDALGNVALFIDGLDEYSGDHAEIIELFEGIRAPNIKLCFSSRPLVIFQDTFNDRPKLKLQDLTFNDVKVYVDDKIAEDKRMKALCIAEPMEAPNLVQELVTQSDGVFLWVILVVRSLLTGLKNQDRISDLKKRLRLIPSEITELYQYMLTQIPAMYLIEGSRLFQLMFASLATEGLDSTAQSLFSLQKLHAVELYFANEDPAIVNIHAGVQTLSKIEVEQKVGEVDCRLRVCCAGLLELGNVAGGIQAVQVPLQALGNRKIEFLHRTTKDFLHTRDVEEHLLVTTSGVDFNPNVALLRSSVLLAKTYMPEPHQHDVRISESDRISLIKKALIFERAAEFETRKPQNTLLDELSRTISQLWRSKTDYVSELLFEYHRWTTGHNNPYRADGKAPDFKNDFLALAITFKLPLYVEAKIQEDRSIIRSKEGRPYLDYALVSRATGKTTVSVQIVELLLRHGSNPNETFDGSTPWKNALLTVYRCNASRYHDPLQRSAWLDWIHAFRLLLQNGADVHVTTTTHQGIKSSDVGLTVFSVTEIINLCFGIDFPKETFQLLALVKKSKARGRKSIESRGVVMSAFTRSKMWLDKRLSKNEIALRGVQGNT
jgi:hypothetical protein